MQTSKKTIGLIPAGGLAKRISPLPCSKELYPIGLHTSTGGDNLRPKVVCQYLLEGLRKAGVTRAFVVLRDGKWDIPRYFGDGGELGMHLAYLMMKLPFGAPFTLDQAYPFLDDARVAFGFPDIVFSPANAFVRLLEHQSDTGADVVLGLFPAYDPKAMDMVEIDLRNRVTKIVVKPSQTLLQYTWTTAVWTSDFTHFMHEHLSSLNWAMDQSSTAREQPELFVGDILQTALDTGMRIEAEIFPDGDFVDIGTPRGLEKATRRLRAPPR